MLSINRRFSFAIALLFIIPAIISSGLEISTGDAELDLTLEKINIEAEADLGAFKADLSLSYDITQNKIEYLLAEIEMEPADVYMTFELAEIADTPVDTVIELYKEHKGKGWGVIAKELGIKPGSSDFMALKKGSSEKLNKIKVKKGKPNKK